MSCNNARARETFCITTRGIVQVLPGGFSLLPPTSNAAPNRRHAVCLLFPATMEPSEQLLVSAPTYESYCLDHTVKPYLETTAASILCVPVPQLLMLLVEGAVRGFKASTVRRRTSQATPAALREGRRCLASPARCRESRGPGHRSYPMQNHMQGRGRPSSHPTCDGG